MTDIVPPIIGEPGREPGPPPPRPPRQEAAFFTWARSLRVIRDDGWLGGVCAGLAARINVDPIIVRGIFVVVALIGFPALLVYAMGWALLPDADGRIHLQELGRRRFDAALIAIAIMALLTFLPGVQWVWATVFWPFAGSWGENRFGLFAVIDGILVFSMIVAGAALAVWFIVWAVRYPGRTPIASPETSTDAAASPSPFEAGSTDVPATPHATADHPTSDAAPLEPSAPARDAADDEMLEWRATHERWRADHEAWRQRQVAADAVAREHERQEKAATTRAYTAEVADQRRIRRAANPRASAVFVLAVLGAALVGGALCTLAIREWAVAAPAGLLTMGLIAAAGMVVAGVVRRRSGFLAFAAAASIIAGVVSGFFGATSTVLLTGYTAISQIGSSEQHYLQPFGSTEIHLFDVTPEGTQGADEFNAGEIELRKGSGDTTIWVGPGTTLLLDAALRGGRVEVERYEAGTGDSVSNEDVTPTGVIDGTARYVQEITSPGEPRSAGTVVPVQIEQSDGSVRVIVTTPRED